MSRLLYCSRCQSRLPSVSLVCGPCWGSGDGDTLRAENERLRFQLDSSERGYRMCAEHRDRVVALLRDVVAPALEDDAPLWEVRKALAKVRAALGGGS